jgi:hypothetical protein
MEGAIPAPEQIQLHALFSISEYVHLYSTVVFAKSNTASTNNKQKEEKM